MDSSSTTSSSSTSCTTSSTWNPNYDVLVSDSEEEDDELKPNYKGREALLFVVDANLYDNQEHFCQALEIIRSALISGLLVSCKDLLGVVFANTEMSPDPYEAGCLDNIVVPPNCAVFLPLRQLSKAIVEHYLRFLETAQTDFGNLYGIADNGGCGDFTAMLRLCVNLFENSQLKLNSAMLVYITDRQTPHPPQSHQYQIALQKARDLDGKAIEFQVVPMVDEFSYEPFYKEFLTLVEDGDIEAFVPPNAEEMRDMLADRKLRQNFLKRSLGHFQLSLGTDLALSAQYYNYFRRRYLPRKVKLLRKDNAVVQRKQVIMARKQQAESMELSEEREVKTTGGWYEIHLGDMPIRITPEQMMRVRNLHTPGMMLLGFKPLTALPDNLYYKPCDFMYPDDQGISGSKRLFCGLWQCCKERNKLAICLFMRKRKSIPRYVALVPVESADSDAGTKPGEFSRPLLSGDGFKIIYLPCEKHIRHTNFTTWNSMDNVAPTAGVELFEKLIGRLRTKFQPNLLSDPTVEVLQSNLLALALNIKTDNAGLTDMPDASRQDDRMAKLWPQIEQIFGEDIEVAKKRTASSAAAGGNAPKAAKVAVDDLQRYDYVQQLVANGTLGSCTVAQLRDILKQHFEVQMAATAKKQALMDRINDLAK